MANSTDKREAKAKSPNPSLLHEVTNTHLWKQSVCRARALTYSEREWMTFHVRYAFQSASDRAATCFPTAEKKSGCSKFNCAKRDITRSACCCKSVRS